MTSKCRQGNARNRPGYRWRFLVVVVGAGAIAVASTQATAIGSRAPSGPAAGILVGQPFTTASAIAERDFYGDVNVYLFTRQRGCGTVSAIDKPYVWISIDSGGRGLKLGTAMSSGNGTRVAANVAYASGTTLLGEGVSITLTQRDPHIGSLWRGSVRIISSVRAGVTDVFSGSFAARWCGKV